MAEKRPVEIKNLNDSSVEITASISIEELNKYKSKVLKEMGENITIDGFRKGHIPEKVLVDKIGELNLLNRMTEMALTDIYPVIVSENNLQVIGQPQINITKMAIGNPVEFKIISAVLPKFDLPDYKKIAKEINSHQEEVTEVSEEEISNTIKQLKQMNTSPVDKDKKGEEKPKEKTEIDDKITDDLVKQWGNFKGVEDFKTKLKENIRQEKINKAIEAKRVKIMDAILEKTKLKLPEIIKASETERLLAQTKADISRMGLQFDKYLEHIKKTEEELKKELRPEAEKRAKIQFILDKIIEKENIKPNEKEVEENKKQIMSQHKETKEEDVTQYVKTILSNQEVFRLLEKQ